MIVQVYIAMLTILFVATAVTLLKIYLIKHYGPPQDPGPTFIPRTQVTGSNIRYGIGVIFNEGLNWNYDCQVQWRWIHAL